jgi:hypothetical protein
MGTILIRNVGILQKSYPLAHRLADMEVIKVADEYDVAFGKTGKVRPLGQFIAVNTALIEPDPAGQIIPTICLNLHIKNSTLFVLHIYIQPDAAVLIAVTHLFLTVEKYDSLNLYAQQRLQKQPAYLL